MTPENPLLQALDNLRLFISQENETFPFEVPTRSAALGCEAGDQRGRIVLDQVVAFPQIAWFNLAVPKVTATDYA